MKKFYNLGTGFGVSFKFGMSYNNISYLNVKYKSEVLSFKPHH